MRLVDPPIRLILAGEGTQRANLGALAERIGVADRVLFLDAVPDEALIELYAEALAVVYAPFDEDFGYVTLESFLARKPVITTTDAGGPLEFVIDGVNGAVVAPAPESVADAINGYAANRGRAAAHGDAGYARASLVTWDGVIEKLVR
jgi:glycosyltransferase involved in cell wall biosynthesis